ncbi:MAG: GDSL-type esterase/lipase family protein [Bacteroidales bacterium]|nr:GDSL-type esterase/lipase family protein [Bacteroidales bacterium]
MDSSRFSAYFWNSKDLFDNLPDIEGEIIFLGNSITDGAEWFELLSNPLCLNRGISGDVTEGVLLRLDAITKCQPAKVFIMIGVNDLALGHSNDYIISNYKKIIAIIAKESPATEIYLQSILPVNPASGMFTKHTDKSDRILEINLELEKLAENSKLQYIDINSNLADKQGFLKAE